MALSKSDGQTLSAAEVNGLAQLAANETFSGTITFSNGGFGVTATTGQPTFTITDARGSDDVSQFVITDSRTGTQTGTYTGTFAITLTDGTKQACGHIWASTTTWWVGIGKNTDEYRIVADPGGGGEAIGFRMNSSGEVSVGDESQESGVQLTVKTDAAVLEDNDLAAAQPELKLIKRRAGSAGADLDQVGSLKYVGTNDAGTPEDVTYANIRALIGDASDATEDGILQFFIALAGVQTLIMSLSNGLIQMPTLPTSDPVVADALWNDSGTLKVSSG